MSEAVRKFVSRLVTVLGEPPTASAAAYAAELTNILGGYSVAELDEAATSLFQVQKTTRWPTPAIMIAHAKEARERLNLRQKSRGPKGNRADAAAWAADWLQSNPLGRRAILECWARALRNILIQKYELDGGPPRHVHFDDEYLRALARSSTRIPYAKLDLVVCLGTDAAETWLPRVREHLMRQADQLPPAWIEHLQGGIR